LIGEEGFSSEQTGLCDFTELTAEYPDTDVGILEKDLYDVTELTSISADTHLGILGEDLKDTSEFIPLGLAEMRIHWSSHPAEVSRNTELAISPDGKMVTFEEKKVEEERIEEIKWYIGKRSAKFNEPEHMVELNEEVQEKVVEIYKEEAFHANQIAYLYHLMIEYGLREKEEEEKDPTVAARAYIITCIPHVLEYFNPLKRYFEDFAGIIFAKDPRRDRILQVIDRPQVYSPFWKQCLKAVECFKRHDDNRFDRRGVYIALLEGERWLRLGLIHRVSYINAQLNGSVLEFYKGDFTRIPKE
jgi:hypothetical protein